MDNAFKYVRDNGIDSENSYPYRGHVNIITIKCLNILSVLMDRMRHAVLM